MYSREIMTDKYEVFVEGVLVNTAFLGGIWSAIELNPQRYALLEIVRILRPYMDGPIMPDVNFIAIIKLAFVLVFLAALVWAATFGNPKGLGLLSFGMAYEGGYIVLSNPQFGGVLLILSLLLAMALETNNQQQRPARPPI